MIAHSNQFKENIKNLGRELDSKITFGSTVLGNEELNTVTPIFQGGLLKSVMKQLDVDSNVDIPIGTEINYKFGVKVGKTYEYLDFGNYIVYSSEKQEDTNSYTIVCYDKMLKSMVDYQDLGITYPVTIRDYINKIAQFMGVEFANKSTTFTNYNKEIPSELFLQEDGGSLDYTFRDVLDQLSQVVAGAICINKEDKLEVRYVNETNDTIDEEFLKDINVNFGEKYGPINSIVLSRSGESDNVYIQDEDSIEKNGLHELKIKDNQIMNFNDRSQYLEGILNRLKGLEFFINDFASTGICYYELYDKYNVQVNDTNYSCIMLNDEILITQGLVENIYVDKPEETKTDYKKADKVDRQINSAYIIVDKRIGEIESKINQTSEVVGELEDSISYFSVELAQNSLTVASNANNTPIISKVYEVPYYGYFKGKQITPNVAIDGNRTGIKTGYNATALTFEVQDGVVIAGVTNTYTITFTYFYGGKNYTTIKNFSVVLAPKGNDGTSVNILGSYDSYEALKKAHPTGNIGDAYIVQGNMYVWNVEEQDWVDVGDIQGPAGKDGQDGHDGKSAYQIWLENGNVGTEEEYLASLKGEQGQAGQNGKDGYTPIKGVDYFDGKDGQNGQDGYTPIKGIDYFDGEDGKDGTSVTITFTSITYQAGTSGTTKPTGTWTTSVPSVSNGQYLWTKTIVNYSDGKSTEAYSVAYKGTNGQDGQDGSNGKDGKDGNGINSITYFYKVTTTQTTPSASSITSTTIPTMTATNKYLWQKEVIDFTDSSIADKTTILLLAVYGNTGQDGKDGKDGEDGYTPVKDVDYFDGYTPIKGVDYFDGKDGANGTSTYFYVRYSANANGSGMTTSPTSTTKYMGTASTTSPTAPTSTSAYTWVEIKGKDGTNGSPGQAGANGATSYLHIKYSDDGLNFTEADDMFALGERPSSWIGQYADFVEADSTNFDDYVWYKFTEDIDETINEMKSDIKKNETDLENTKQDIIDELDKKANSEELKVVVNEIKSLQTANSIVTTIVEDIQVNGVSQVKQENIFTLNKDGFIFEETGAKTKTIVNNKGVDVLDAQGSGNDLLYAGYVDEAKAESNSKFKEYEGQSIVYSNNMVVDNYMAVGKNSRMEDYEGNGTGMFYTGG